MAATDAPGAGSDESWVAGLCAEDPALAFACPRCHASVEARLYGPCPACRDELRATMARRAQEVEVEAYEPRMHVTPNAVALKD